MHTQLWVRLRKTTAILSLFVLVFSYVPSAYAAESYVASPSDSLVTAAPDSVSASDTSPSQESVSTFDAGADTALTLPSVDDASIVPTANPEASPSATTVSDDSDSQPAFLSK